MQIKVKEGKEINKNDVDRLTFFEELVDDAISRVYMIHIYI